MKKEMDNLENHNNKKYEYLNNDYDTIYEVDKERELLTKNYNTELDYNYENNLINENDNNLNDYANINDFHYIKNDNKNNMNLEKIKLINDNNKQLEEINKDYDNININFDSNEECSETHYDFENKYNDDKNSESNILIESGDIIPSERSHIRTKVLVAGKIALILFLFLLIIFAFTKFKKFLILMHIVIEWVGKQGSWSIVLFILLFTFLSPLFMSVEIMCIGSGLIFSGVYGKVLGVVIAVFSVAVGYVLGMSLCFFISRYLIHNYIYKKLMVYPIYLAFNQAINSNGLSFVLLIRLSPILPASLVSYILGVTSLKYKDFAIGSVSALPSIFLFVYIGALLQDISNLSELENHWSNLVILFIGFIIGVVAIIYITIITKRRLNNLNIMNTSLSTTNVDIE
ncbi:SNARE associated Golgi protein, putative [Plasmodium gallinaceum]|uniref:SNARE associated Golgi protein, putative n=1 Tax=Plasmodium gallinaceum TaxID=5849 RepID=A0A1J1GNG7_PLAGA|nr:SNARE associated Golgi protein, putative [Plasmodium gallinaceum]CRG94015.1 SNARE associated Golgi protein, putative [Plasmodium gallinaceum]